jgi:hypothetical protein
MKTIITIITIIVLEACALTWLFSAENDKLKAENSTLKHQLAYQRDKNAELQWFIAKMDLLHAGKTAEEIFSKEENTAEIKEDDNEKEEDVIYLD